MAKRFNISIPDALAERLEPFKDKLSLSAVMQAALERELAQLTLPDEEKDRRATLKAVAMNSWTERNPFIAKILGSFIQDLFDKASNDGLSDLFQYFRYLYVLCRPEELVNKISIDQRYFPWLGPLHPGTLPSDQTKN